MKSKTPEGGGIVGFIFGLFLGAAVTAWLSRFGSITVAVVAGIIVGVLGYFFGDRFWYWLLEKFHWLV